MSPNPAQRAHHAVVNLLGVLVEQNRADQVAVEPAHDLLLTESQRLGNTKSWFGNYG
jgi:hypothetical protein